MGEAIDDIIEEFKDRLTMDGRKRVFEDGSRLKSEYLKKEAKPESITVEFLIKPILEDHNIDLLPERKFKGIRGDNRWADHEMKSSDGRKMLMEAKSVNKKLDTERQGGALNQVQGLFRLAEVRDDYEFGIATDGLRWIIVDREARIVYDIDIRDDYEVLSDVLGGEATVSAEKIEEEISKKFYDWYDALLHGGTYKDHKDETRKISEEDSLVENIAPVTDEDDCEQLAQTIMDRLIFLRFLQAKGIIDFDLLDYLSDLDEDVLNAKLKQLFFQVMNLRPERRSNIDDKFDTIPYLNGSLFVRTSIEKDHPDYAVRADILRKVIDFLDSFQFVHKEERTNKDVLDPEILGYIFERAMTAAEQKETGAYYTPRNVTYYIAEHTVYPALLDEVNALLEEKGYKESELLDEVEEIYRLREKTLIEVFNEVLPSFSVCDNACGSGAFLLAAADTLLSVYQNISEELRLGHSEVALRMLILKNNLYGVDINPNAIEIAKLRLWLWLVDAYDPEKVQPLPNIDYNLRVGNSLIGYGQLPDFDEDDPEKVGTYKSEEKIRELMEERAEKVRSYKDAEGQEARDLYNRLQELDEEIENWLDIHFTGEIHRTTDLSKEDVEGLETFHWGMEFQNVFEDGGFDVIIGNPPYVRQEGLGEMKDYLKTIYDVYHGRADLYQYFFERSMETLDEDGYFGYIVSNKWLRTGYGEPLRKYLDQFRVEEFIDFGDTAVFRGVAAYPCITLLKKNDEPNEEIVAAEIETTEFAPLEAFMEQNSYIASQEALGSSAWSFPRVEVMDLMDKIDEAAISLENYLESHDMEVHYGIKTGHTEAFTIDEETKEELIAEDPNSKELIKPFLTGRYIRRYHIKDSGKYLIFAYQGVDIDNYPAIRDYLSQWREELEPKDSQDEEGPGRSPGDHEWYEIQSTVSYSDEFEEPKLIYGAMTTATRFSIDREGYYANNASFFINDDNKALLGILNSTLGWFLITQTCTKIQSGYQLIWKYFGGVPVPENESDRLGELVNQMLNLKERQAEGEDVEDEIKEVDEEIDREVFDLYGLEKEERQLVREEVNL